MSPRVLHVIDHLGAGGAQQWLVDMLPRLRELGWEGRVVALHGQGADLERFARAAIESRPLTRSRALLPLAVPRLARILRSQPPEILHLHLVASWFVGSLSATLAGRRPIVLHDQSADELRLKNPALWRVALRPALGRLARRADAVIPCSKWVARYDHRVLGVPRERIHVIPNAAPVEELQARIQASRMDRSHFLPPEAGLLAACVGRLVSYKGFDIALRAVAEARTHVPVSLLILGDGPERSRLTNLARDLSIGEAVHFAGHTDQVAEHLAVCDLFLFPSLFEPFGIVALEAMAAGLPVIGSRTGGIPTTVKEGETGYLFDPGDWRGCAGALVALAKDPERRTRMGDAGRRRVRERFDTSVAARAVARVYESLAR